MKLRIVTDGIYFKVQYRAGPFWRDCRDSNTREPKFFESKQAAKEFIWSTYGNSAEYSNEWWPTSFRTK